MEKGFINMLDNLNFDDVVVLKGEVVNFQGNIINIDKEGGYFEFYVTHSDDEDSIGNTISINHELMDAMFKSLEIKRFKRAKEDVLTLIDFILSIQPLDVGWLEEKRKELIAIENREKFVKSRRMVV